MVALPSQAIPGIPIYCRRFKGNCKRIKSTCCNYVDQITSSSTTSTTTAYEEEYEEEYVDELEAGDGDPLDAQPSYVEEVFVKPTMEELNLVSESEEPAPTPPSSQYAPRFCSILKFNCATRGGHPCYRHPLKPEDASRSRFPSLKSNPAPAASKREEEPTKENIEETNVTAGDDLTRKEQKTKFSKPARSKFAGHSKAFT